MVSADLIRKEVFNAGFSLCGIACCRTLTEQKVFFRTWLESAHHSSLGYMTRYEDVRFDPSVLFEGTKSVIVCAVNYKNDTMFESQHSANPKIASYALCTDYHITIKRMLSEVVQALQRSYPQLQARIFTDTAPILEKAWAVEAGLGWIGKNSLLVTPEYGSLVLLGEILIDVEVDSYDSSFVENRCGTCRRCMDACPNSAIVSPKVIDAGRCISRITIEKNPPEGSEKLLHGWIFGCDICQGCCPYNAKTPTYANVDFKPLVDPHSLTREFWLACDTRQFKTTFGHTPIFRSKLETIQQNCTNTIELY